MSLFAWLLLILLVVLISFGVVLGVTLIKLGGELKRLGDDTETMVSRLQRSLRTVQAAVPVIALARRGIDSLLTRRKKGKRNEQ